MSHPVTRQLRDFVVGALLALLVATIAFVAVRNQELVQNQLERARAATAAIAAGAEALPDIHAVIVGRPVASDRYSFVRRRQVFDRYSYSMVPQWLPLAASLPDEPNAPPDAKLIYDAATRFDRKGAFAELVPDGSARAIATRSVPPSPGIAHGKCARENDCIAVAITPPARPAPYPWLVIIGVLGLGAAIAAAGALIAGERRRSMAAFIGTFVGVGALSIPCMLWRSPVASTAILVIAGALAFLQHAQLTHKLASGVRLHRTALGFLAPAAIAMFVLVAAPFVIGLVLGFYDHPQGTWTFVGLHNFGEILSGGGRPLDDPLNFWFILGVTVLWTLANVALHVTLGVMLALVLSRKWLRGKGIFRMLFILPWAVPNYITALIWKGMFTGEHGAVNSLLGAAGLDGVSWFSSWAASFSANVITNTWLGFPFMMVVALGALESIPKELYEAASVDGATAWQRFRHITLPHLRPALGPAVALGSIWTFNMFNVIYLVSGGAPGGSTNILVTDAYRWAFERGERYGMAAAYATIIFLILLLWTVFGTRIVRSKGQEKDS